MADEPSFPSPDEARKERSAYREAASRPAQPVATPRIVTRAEPPPPSSKEPKRGSSPTGLTAEEIRAIAAVGMAGRSTSGEMWQRGRIVIVPVGLISAVVQFVFGRAAPFLAGAIIVAGLLYTAGPLFKKKDWD